MFLVTALAASLFGGCGSKAGDAHAGADTAEKADAGTEAAEKAGAEADEEAGAETDEETGAEADEETRAEAGVGANAGTSADAGTEDSVEVQAFIAASLNTVMQEVAAAYNKDHPNVKIIYNADSSGKLLTQIEEGFACDVFFSAAQKQMDALEADGLIVDGSRANVVNNQLVVIKRKDTESSVKGLGSLKNASSIALADGSVPVGKYTRQALVALGILPEAEDVSLYTSAEISKALGGVEISEQGNASQVLTAVLEGSCEVGTTYYSDTYGYEDELEILEVVSYDLTGNVIYPVCQVVNDEASDAEKAAAADFVKFITSDTAKEIFEAYYFDTAVG